MTTEIVETGQAEAAGFRAPGRFSHTGTDMAGAASFGSSAYRNGEPGAPQARPSYHMREYGYTGVQNPNVPRSANGWPQFRK